MKLFSCYNEECPGHCPDVSHEDHPVKERIVSDHPIDEQGNFIESARTELVDRLFVCGICGEDMREVPYDEVMEVNFTNRDGDYVYGTYSNPLRGGEFDIRINVNTGVVEYQDIDVPRPDEDEYIKNKFKESYKDTIVAEVFDVNTKGMDKTYEVYVQNPVEDREYTAYVTDDKITTNSFNPTDIEKAKILKAVRRSIF